MVAISTPLGSAHDDTPAVLARYHTLVDARSAIRHLEADGLDGDDLALVGEAAHVEATTERQVADRRILPTVSLALGVGLLSGAIVGTVLGAAVMGPVALLRPSIVDSMWVFVLVVGSFAAGLAVLGAITRVARAVGSSESVPLSGEDDPDAPIWLAVYGETPRIRAEVEATRPLEIVDDPVVTAHPEEVLARAS